MSKNETQLTTLVEIAKELKMNKSRLAYYASLGLIRPIVILGSAGAYDKKKTIATIRKIEELKKKNKTLRQIIMIIR